MAVKKYFGTDGVRGKAGESPLTADFVERLARAAARALVPPGGSVVIGKDTRVSGPMFEEALEKGFVSMGINVKHVGVLPTPGVAYMTRHLKCDLGVVVSASHNVYSDNGIKFFDAEGGKLTDETEEKIESLLDTPPEGKMGVIEHVEEGREAYERFVVATAPRSNMLAGLKLVVDCANGAGYEVAPRIFSALGAEVISIATEPDGKNINDRCGATSPENMQAVVREKKADAGIALDGDGDRLIMADSDENIVNGDLILFILATSYQEQGLLKGPVVGTVMSNMGVELALKEAGVNFLRAQVGDRQIMSLLRENEGILGGEPSGHIILLNKTTTGDGIIAALQVLSVMAEKKKTLKEFVSGVTLFPQILLKVPLKKKMNVEEVPGLTQAVERIEKEFVGKGRVVVRPSGTESVMRVMVEHESREAAEKYADELVGLIKKSA